MVPYTIKRRESPYLAFQKPIYAQLLLSRSNLHLNLLLPSYIVVSERKREGRWWILFLWLFAMAFGCELPAFHSFEWPPCSLILMALTNYYTPSKAANWLAQFAIFMAHLVDLHRCNWLASFFCQLNCALECHHPTSLIRANGTRLALCKDIHHRMISLYLLFPEGPKSK